MPTFIYRRKTPIHLTLLIILILVTAACQDTPTPDQVTVPISSGRVKIEISQNGPYAIPLADLQSLGADIGSLDSNQLRLTSQGEPVPYILRDDTLLFYGRASDNLYTASRPYILHIAPHEGDNVQMEMVTQPQSTDNAPLIETVWRPLMLEQSNVYVSNARTPVQTDTWYWHTLHVGQSFTTDITLENVASDTAELTLGLWGASLDSEVENDHDFDLVINEQKQATIMWDGQTYHSATLTLPAGTLQSGTNTFLLDNSVPGATFVDIMQFDQMQLLYPATAEAVDDRLDFTNTSGRIQLSGFTADPLVLDITDPANPTIIAEAAEVTASAEQHILAVGPEGYLTPDHLTGLRDSSLTDRSNQADLIIITTETLAPAVQPLVTAREAQGLSVTVAPVAEIYDAFGDGLESPESINNFLRYAHTEWQEPAPRYLLLVGDGTYDNRNYLGQRPENNIPTFIIPVTHSGETVSDARLADIDDDMRPNMAVGRWPVDSVSEVENLVERTLAYEQGSANQQSLFTADGSSTEFTGMSDYLIDTSVLQTNQVDKLYGATFEEVTNAWNNGAWLVTYVGHGSLNLWGKDSVFNIDAVGNLQTNESAPPIVLQFTCLTGFYAHPSQQSISEAMLTHPDGPVLLVAATSLTLSSQQQPFALATINNLSNPEFERVGDALWAAKQTLDVSNLGLREISDTFGLLGDPSALIVRPSTASESEG